MLGNRLDAAKLLRLGAPQPQLVELGLPALGVRGCLRSIVHAHSRSAARPAYSSRIATTWPSDTASPTLTRISRSVPVSSTMTGICIFIDSMNITASPAVMRSPTLLSIWATNPITSDLASIFAIPPYLTCWLSVARRPRPHQVLADTTAHAQAVHIEHADQVVAR